MNYPVEVKTHTALHILKGAVVKVLGEDALWTARTYVDGSHGVLTVKFNRKPMEKEMKMIEELANKKIMENVNINILELDRNDAEKKFGDIIYDLFPIPENIKRLKIVYIDGWNINACDKEHTYKTGDVGGIKIRRMRFRSGRQHLEISYDIV